MCLMGGILSDFMKIFSIFIKKHENIQIFWYFLSNCSIFLMILSNLMNILLKSWSLFWKEFSQNWRRAGFRTFSGRKKFKSKISRRKRSKSGLKNWIVSHFRWPGQPFWEHSWKYLDFKLKFNSKFKTYFHFIPNF